MKRKEIIKIFTVLFVLSLHVLALPQLISISTTGKLNKQADQVGIWLHSNQDIFSDEYVDALGKLNMKSIRHGWATAIMDNTDPDKFYVSPKDPGVLAYISDSEYLLRESIKVSEVAELTERLEAEAYAVLSIDGVLYTGSVDAEMAALSHEEREQIYVDNAVRWASWAVDNSFSSFIIGNESDISGELSKKEACNCGEDWTGLEYGTIAGKIAKAIKAEYPEARVGINGGWRATETARTAWWDEILEAAPDINDYIDFVIVHTYAFGISAPQWESSTWNWGRLRSDIIRDVAAKFPGKPIVVGEIGGFDDGVNQHYRALLNCEMLACAFLDDLVGDVIHWPSRWGYNGGAFSQHSNQLLPLGNGLAAYSMFAKPVLTDLGATHGVKYFAAKDTSDNSLSVWFINHKPTASVADVSLRDFVATGENEVWTLTSPGDNPTAKENTLKKIGSLEVNVEDGSSKFKVSLSPTSATIVRFNLNPENTAKVLRLSTSGSGDKLSLAFNENISSEEKNIDGFSLRDGNGEVTFSHAHISEVNENVVELELSESIRSDQELTLSYVPGDLMSDGGAAVDSLTDLAVINNVPGNELAPGLLSAVTNPYGNLVYLHFSKAMQAPDDHQAFSVTREGMPAKINTLKLLEGDTIMEIGLMSTPAFNDLLVLDYVPGNIRTEDGEPLESLISVIIDNMAQPGEVKQSAYGSQSPWAISDGLLIEAENYDNGGKGIAFFDDDFKAPGSETGVRIVDGADIYSTYDGFNGYSVGDIKEGEWLEYTVSVEPGIYTIKARIASEAGEGKIDVVIDSLLVASLEVSSTGGQETFEYVELPEVELEYKKKTVLRLAFDGGDYFLNYLLFSKTGNPTSADSDISAAEDEKQDPRVYPNPAKNTLYVNQEGQYSLSILDAAGRVLYLEQGLEGQERLDISGLEDGFYFYRIKQAGETFSGKFLKY